MNHRKLDEKELWSLVLETENAIVQQYRAAFDQFRIAKDVDNWTTGILISALTFEPQAISPALLSVRGPYTAVETYLEKLADAASRGLLTEVDPGSYHLTAVGRADIQNLIDQGRDLMAMADPLPRDDSLRLADMLRKLVVSCLEAPSPPGKWCIRHSWKLMPTNNPPLPYTEQAISCLSGYRDDAHLAAWQASGLSAAALEALTIIWRDEATSLDELFQKLSRRGHNREVYSRALDQLRRLTLIVGSNRSFRLTPSGQVFRDQIERDTDEYFFKSWSCLEAEERVELADLLERLQTLLWES